MKKKKLGFIMTAMLLVSMLFPMPAMAAPAPPTSLAATLQAGPPLSVRLDWTPTTGEIGYRVYRAVAGPAPVFAQIPVGAGGVPVDLPAGSTFFIDNTVATGVTYLYRITAFNADPVSESAPSNTVLITATMPAAPSGAAATQTALGVTPQTVTLTWTDNSANEIGFKIERADDTGFTQNVVRNAVPANINQFIDAAILPGSTYSYRVSALGHFGASAVSNTVTITVNAAAGMVAGPPVPVAGFGVNSGYPMYYQDILGTKLAMLPIDPTAVAGPDTLHDAPTAAPYSVALGFGTEAFYYDASAQLAPFAGVENTVVTVLFAIEAIFTTPFPDGAPVAGNEAVMNRTRIRMDVPVAGTYTITTPYHFGANALVVDAAPTAGTFDINITIDILGPARDFATAATGPVNVFLRPTGVQTGGFFGDALTAGTVTGAPGQPTSVTVTGPGGISTTTNLFIIAGKLLSAPVTPSFTKTITPASQVTPAAVAFTDTSVGNPTGWLWDFGDGTTSTLQHPPKTYTAAGNFIAKLTASNAGGSAPTSQMVSTFGTPSAAFTMAQGATQLTVNFSSSPTGNPTGWLWDFGDGTTSTLRNPIHAYVAAGDFTVTLSVFSPAGTVSASQLISVGPPNAPTNLQGVVAGTAAAPQINLSWTDNSANETRFLLERAENLPINTADLTYLARDVAASAAGTSGGTITFNDVTGITTNKIFHYRVSAFRDVFQSAVTATISVTVGGPPTGTAPVLTASLVDGDPVTVGTQLAVSLTWTDTATNEDVWHMHRAPTAAFNPAQIVHVPDIPVGTTTLLDTNGIVDGATFFYFVHAMNALGEGTNSNTVQISIGVPSAPADLVAVVASPTSVTLNWTATSGATSYIIQRSDNGGAFAQIGTSTVATFPDNTVSAGNTYDYRLLATNIVGDSLTFSATATANMTAPAAPVLVDPATAQGTGEIVLNWNNVLNETGYRIMRAIATAPGVFGTPVQIAEVGVDVITYTDVTALPETEYQYTVVAFNGLSGPTDGISNAVEVTSAIPTSVNPPTGLATPTIGSNTVVLTWTDASANEIGFRIERLDTDGITWIQSGALVAANATTGTATGLVPITLYTFRVVAISGALEAPSATTIDATTVAPPPVIVGGGGGGGGGGGLLPATLTGLSGSLLLNSEGNTLTAVNLSSFDGSLKLNIASGTKMLDSGGNPLGSLSMTAAASPPATPPQFAVVLAQDMGPNGATFSPAITLTLSYDPAALPAGAVEDDLVIAFWDGSQWQIMETTVDPQTNTVSAQVSHFTTFAILAQQATVNISSPQDGATLEPGNITVSVNVSNFNLVAPGGDPVAGEGHLHYYLDVDIPTTPGQPAVSAPGTYKADPATSMVWENVTPGTHTFGVQLVNKNHTPLDPPVTATVTVTVNEPPAPAPSPTVRITSPAAGATITGTTVTVRITATDITLVPPGAPAPGEGHVHYYMDVNIPTTPGAPAVTAPGTYKADPGTSINWENVTPGTHTFGVQLVQGNHTPFEPPVTATVTVTVNAPAPVPTTPTTPAPEAPPTGGANWGLIGALIAAAIVVIVVIALLRRKGTAKG